MGHSVVKDQVYRRLTKPFACVTVTVQKKGVLVIKPNSFGVAQSGVLFAELPEKWKVVDPDPDETEPVLPSRQFYISVETIDPYHILIDAPKEILL